jgi:hypothetical protein
LVIVAFRRTGPSTFSTSRGGTRVERGGLALDIYGESLFGGRVWLDYNFHICLFDSMRVVRRGRRVGDDRHRGSRAPTGEHRVGLKVRPVVLARLGIRFLVEQVVRGKGFASLQERRRSRARAEKPAGKGDPLGTRDRLAERSLHCY